MYVIKSGREGQKRKKGGIVDFNVIKWKKEKYSTWMLILLSSPWHIRISVSFVLITCCAKLQTYPAILFFLNLFLNYQYLYLYLRPTATGYSHWWWSLVFNQINIMYIKEKEVDGLDHIGSFWQPNTINLNFSCYFF